MVSLNMIEGKGKETKPMASQYIAIVADFPA
jgi:hypothetical protein